MRHLTALAVALVAMLLAGAGQAVVTTPVACGDLITKSIVVGNDLTDCPGTALNAGANGITINLNGHTIDGANTATGDGVEIDAFKGVTVENGTVQQFNIGVADVLGSSNRIINVTSQGNAADGFLIQSPRSTVQRSYSVDDNTGFAAQAASVSFSKDVARATTANGFILDGSLDSMDSSVVGFAGAIGVSSPAGTGVRITNNRITAATSDGIRVDGTGATISGNEITTANAMGIHVTQSATSITKNAIGETGQTGISVATSSSTTISLNVIGKTGSGADGIDVGGGSGAKILSNSLSEVGGTGISSDAPGSVVTGNTVGIVDAGNGIVVQSTDAATVTSNKVQVAHTDGIDVTAAAPSTVSDNTVVQAQGGEGILVDASMTKVTKNVVQLANGDGIHISTGTNGDTIQGNVAELAIGGDGILVEGDGHSILQNIARGNLNIGIHDTSSGSKVTQNVAVGNEVGITTGGIDGGGNKAAGNSAAQCGGVVCTAP